MTSEQLARLCAGIPVQTVPGFTGTKPLPVRSSTIDPETQLKRCDRLIRPMHEGGWADKAAQAQLQREDARRIRAMADSL